MINAKKQRKTTEWQRLESSSRKLDSKGTFHTKMGTIMDRKGMDTKEAEDIKKRWNCTKKIFMTQIITMV